MVIKLRLHSKRKQMSGSGTIRDYDVIGSKKIGRVKVASRRGEDSIANIHYLSGRKEGFEFKGINKLKKKISRLSK